MRDYDAELIMAGLALGIAALVKIAKVLTEGAMGNAKMKAAIKRLKEEAAEKERLALAAKAEAEKDEEEVAAEEESVTEDKVEEETAEVTETNQEETMAITEAAEVPEEDEALEEAVVEDAVMEEGNWKCPQCGRINPAYLYACICGNRFR